MTFEELKAAYIDSIERDKFQKFCIKVVNENLVMFEKLAHELVSSKDEKLICEGKYLLVLINYHRKMEGLEPIKDTPPASAEPQP
jgi:hypothetical protein